MRESKGEMYNTAHKELGEGKRLVGEGGDEEAV